MKYITSLIILYFSCTLLYGQDLIYLKNQEKIEAKILLVEKKTITYTDFKNPQGPQIKISKREIQKIEYEDGSIEVLSNPGAYVANYRSNVVSFNYGDLIFLRLGASYEKITSEGYFGIKIPLSISFRNQNDLSVEPIFQSGFDLNFYPIGQKRASYYTGVGTRVGIMGSYEGNYDPFTGGYGELSYMEENFAGVYVNNGLIFHFTNQFSVNGMFGLGFRNDGFYNQTDTHGIGELSASFRF